MNEKLTRDKLLLLPIKELEMLRISLSQMYDLLHQKLHEIDEIINQIK